jgi:glycosyltransferase involved in cell wall biosynthesis
VSDWYEECLRRFPAEAEEFGVDKPVNRIQPLVSVWIPTYQHGAFIRECLDGVLMQVTSFPVEIIVGEDESTDGTREICIEYAKQHPDRIRLFLRSRARSHWTDGGTTRFFNGVWAWLSARGKYVALCEGDDCWTDPTKLQKQVDLLELRPDVTLCCHRVVTGSDSKANGAVYPGHPKPLINTLEDVLPENWIATCSIVLRREVLQDYPGWARDLTFSDWPIQVMAAKRGNIGFLDAVMGFYRVHAGGQWSGLGGVKRLQDTLKFYFALKDEVSRRAWNRGARRRVAQLKMQLAAEYRALGDLKAARKAALEALRNHPKVALSQALRLFRSFRRRPV